MPLAVDHAVTIGGARLVLRPTLRAAIRLDRQHGLQALITGIADGSLSVIRDVLAESADPSAFDPRLLLSVGSDGLAPTIEGLTSPLLAHVLALYGIDPDRAPDPDRKPCKRPRPGDPLAELFAVATGVLGWSPEQAYAASPAEIMAAQSGRNRFVGAILRAVFGGAEEAPDGPDDAELDRTGLDSLRAMCR